MKITEVKIKVSDISGCKTIINEDGSKEILPANGFEDDGENGVFAYDGKLTIRPAYQREFVYELKEEEAVINTICKGFPLNSMYWALTEGSFTTKLENEERVLVPSDDAKFEVMDGQQRTLSVMYFLTHQFGIENNSVYWDTLPDNKYEALMNYKFTVYICEGTEEEKLEWFRVVNIAGKELSEQELRNASYTGTWLSDAKRYFSKTNGAGYLLSKNYIKADVIRQGLLEKALEGICEYQGIKGDNRIEQYMGKHKSDPDADELWQYFQDVIAWVKKIFSISENGNGYYKDMLGIDWCHLYNEYHEKKYNTTQMKADVKALHEDDEVQSSKGIYEYLLLKDDNLPKALSKLNLRAFTDTEKQRAYNKQDGICPMCKKKYAIEDMRGDHIVPWSKGGKTTEDNLQMLCKDCNGLKSDKY